MATEIDNRWNIERIEGLLANGEFESVLAEPVIRWLLDENKRLTRSTTPEASVDGDGNGTVSETLAGTCAVGPLDCSMVEFLRGLKYFMDEESRGFRCDTHLLNILRRAACVAWELEREWNTRFSAAVPAASQQCDCPIITDFGRDGHNLVVHGIGCPVAPPVEEGK